MPMILNMPVAALVDVLATIVFVLFMLSAFLLTIVVLLQEGKGGGLTGAFGGAGADAFGVKAGTVNRFTAWLGAAFLGLALLHAGLVSSSSTLNLDDPSTKPKVGEVKDDKPKGGANANADPDANNGAGDPKGDEGAGDPKDDNGNGNGDPDKDGGAGDPKDG